MTMMLSQKTKCFFLLLIFVFSNTIPRAHAEDTAEAEQEAELMSDLAYFKYYTAGCR